MNNSFATFGWHVFILTAGFRFRRRSWIWWIWSCTCALLSRNPRPPAAEFIAIAKQMTYSSPLVVTPVVAFAPPSIGGRALLGAGLLAALVVGPGCRSSNAESTL